MIGSIVTRVSRLRDCIRLAAAEKRKLTLGAQGWAGEHRDFFAGLLSLLSGTAVV